MPSAVTEGPSGWDFRCPVTDGSCGPDPFTSTGWPTKKLATLRGEQHLAEHSDGVVVQPLDDFRAKHGVTVTDDGKAVQRKKG